MPTDLSNDDLQSQVFQLQTFQLVLTGLASSATFNSGALDASLREVTQTVAEALHTELCCVWQKQKDTSAGFDCLCRYDLSTTAFSSGCDADLSQIPEAIESLSLGRAVEFQQDANVIGSCFPEESKHWHLSPVVAQGKLWGVLATANSNAETSSSSTENHFLNHVAALLPMALLAADRAKVQDELQQAKEEAEQANRAKAQFLANMSHEIRTPLTAIIGFAESMINSDQTMEERIEAIHAVTRNSKHLQGLISDILDFSKIEAERIEVESREVPVVSLLDEVRALGISQARDKGVEFSVHHMLPLPAAIQSDPTRIKQILINLIGNAIKFTPSPGAVRLIVSYDAESRQLVLTVQDTGVGIEQSALKRLFQPFTQEDGSTTRKFGGTGLGLAISKELAQKLGGDIRVVSAKGAGSLFVVTLSVGDLDELELIHNVEQSAEASTVGAPVVIRPEQLGGTILVTDDNPDNQRLISLMIRRTGAKSMSAMNGQEALELAQVEEFDLVLMDMQMPVMGGLEATEMLRLTGIDTPILALTANATESDRTAALEAGCDGFLTKPIDQEAFFAALHQYLPPGEPDDKASSASGLTDLEEDPEFQRIRAEFYNELPDRIEAIGASIEDKDWAELRSLSHQLKGVAGSFGIPEATRLAGALEFQALRKDHGEVKYLFDELESLCKTAT